MPATPAESQPTPKHRSRVRMSAAERREQLIDVSRKLFADKGFEGSSVEEIAARAQVSKPIVYEHFGGKEGIYAVVVDREVQTLLGAIRGALANAGRNRETIEYATLALLDYIESHPAGFRILSRDSPVGGSSTSFATILSDVTSQVEDLLAGEFKKRKLDAKDAPMYAQMLVGMIAMTGQWWLDARRPKKPEVAAHLVNLAWNGLANLESHPKLNVERDC